MNDPTRWLVICLDDSGTLILATRETFPSPSAAKKYADGIAPDRNAKVVAASGILESIRLEPNRVRRLLMTTEPIRTMLAFFLIFATIVIGIAIILAPTLSPLCVSG